MKRIAGWKLGALAMLLVAGQAMGTAQAPDTLVLDGKDESLNTNPLNPWLAQHPRALPEGASISSSNWRGYIATWQVDKGKLWLRKVEMRLPTGVVDAEGEPKYKRRDVMTTLFPDRREVVADWFSGVLIVPKGEQVEYVHMGYGSTYERYTIVWVRKGEVSRRLDLDAAQFLEFRKERFEVYKRSEAYRKQLADSQGQLGADTERFIFDFEAEKYLSADLETPVN